MKAMWFVEGFTTFEQLGKQDEHPYNRRDGGGDAKREGRMNFKVYFRWFEHLPNIHPMEITVTCSPFYNSVVGHFKHPVL